MYTDSNGYTYLTCHYDSDTGICVKCGHKLGSTRLIPQGIQIAKIKDMTILEPIMKTYEITICLPFTYQVEGKNAWEAEREAEKMACEDIDSGCLRSEVLTFIVKDVRLLNNDK